MVCMTYVFLLNVFFFFFFKQKTAYEMRISDWSSDVCSSDLLNRAEAAVNARTPLLAIKAGANGQICYQVSMHEPSLRTSRLVIAGGLGAAIEIGRASCRERVCQYV